MKAGICDRLGLTNLQTRPRRAIPKGSTVVRRMATRRQKAETWKAAQDQVWIRDGRVSRASGTPLVRAHTDARKRGEVAHLKSRGAHPDQKYDLRNLVLLSAEEHAQSDARTAPGGRVLLTIQGGNANKALTFIRRDTRGREVWRRTSAPTVPVKRTSLVET